MATLHLNSNAEFDRLLPAYVSSKYLERMKLLSLSRIVVSAKTERDAALLKPTSDSDLGDDQILAYIVRVINDAIHDPDGTYGQLQDLIKQSQDMIQADFGRLSRLCQGLNTRLTLRTYVVGYTLSIADVALWSSIKANKAGKAVLQRIGGNLVRWYSFIGDLDNGWITAQADSLRSKINDIKNAKGKDGASYALTGIQNTGPFVTRFPPEPSGYLHIGHAKAALLNDYFARVSAGGTIICRFDDTNPSKESQEFQDSILDDLKSLEIYPGKVSYSSDYFQDMCELAIKLIKDDKAFADDSELGKGDTDRRNRLPSVRRDMSVDETLQHFAEMETGSTEGQRWCIRARIAYDSPNGTLRDPVIYRCNLTPHHRTGNTWKIYPTYDFCAPILDSIEGVTLALRTNEYRDRNAQYEWMQENLGLRRVTVYDFSRMNFIRTVLSKRKLAKIVALGKVSGWDDPRMPTIRGVLRRGMTVAALREFILAQGPSRNILNLEWGVIWALNKKRIDPIAPRLVAIKSSNAVKCRVTDFTGPDTAQWPKHAKNSSLGSKIINYSSSVLIEQLDAASFDKDEEITLMSWGNAFVRHIEKSDGKVTELGVELNLDGDVRTTKKKITWLPSEKSSLVEVCLSSFDHLITKDKLEKTDELEQCLTEVTETKTRAWTDGNVRDVKKGDVIQFERKGYYRLDATPADGPLTFFEIPS